jgi:hypothetical protein
MFRQLQVHTPAPLTPDGQCAADQATEMISLSLTPARGRGDEAGTVLALGPATRSTAMAERHQSNSNDSSTDNDLRCCTRCGEQ